MNEQLIEELELEENSPQTQESTAIKETVTYLIFLIGTERYAIASKEVEEIIRDVEVYPLPFVPPYLEGVLNRRGMPYTVLDPVKLLELPDEVAEIDPPDRKERDSDSDKAATPLFLVLNIPNDQLCLHITDIVSFHDITYSDIRVFKDSASNGNSIYKGTFEYERQEIPILNTDVFETRLRNDLSRKDFAYD